MEIITVKHVNAMAAELQPNIISERENHEDERKCSVVRRVGSGIVGGERRRERKGGQPTRLRTGSRMFSRVPGVRAAAHRHRFRHNISAIRATAAAAITMQHNECTVSNTTLVRRYPHPGTIQTWIMSRNASRHFYVIYTYIYVFIYLFAFYRLWSRSPSRTRI